MKAKKAIAAVLVLILALSLTGCGSLLSRLIFGTTLPANPSSAAESSAATSEATEPMTSGSSETTPDASTETPSTETPATVPSTDGTTAETETAAPTTEATAETSDPWAEVIARCNFTEVNDTVYTTTGVNVRKGPTTDAEVLTVATASTMYTRTAVSTNWSRVIVDGGVAYICNDYLTTAVPTLDTKPLTFGFSHQSERDEKNVPTAMYWYIRNWGDYATFLQDTNQNLIYLTMDEGYENGNTPRILDILKEKKVTAVFFLTGEFMDTHPELVQRMIDEGHILGNHTKSHYAMNTLTYEQQYEEVMYVHNKLLNDFGYTCKLFRFPSGEYSDQCLANVASWGYRSVFWSFYHRDWYTDDQPAIADAFAMATEELHPGAIYLLHAVSDTNTAMLADWIDYARAHGFEFGVYPVN